MKHTMTCAVAAAAFAMCRPAMGEGEALHPPDASNPYDNMSQICYDGGFSFISADYWVCMDGQPINAFYWTGQYHQYLTADLGAVAPPAHQPTSFLLRQYADDGGKPGNALNETVCSLAECNEAFFATLTDGGGYCSHLFSYKAVLAVPWQQTAGTIYWLSVIAQYDVSPSLPTDGYTNWGWTNTPPSTSFINGGHELNSMGSFPWMPLTYLAGPYFGQPVNFAFEIGLMPVHTVPNKTSFANNDSISITAYVAATTAPCWPFVRVIQPDGQALYLHRDRGFLPSPTPYLGLEAGPITLSQYLGYPVLTGAQFSNMPSGTYYLESGAADVATTSVDDLRYVGMCDSTTLVIP